MEIGYEELAATRAHIGNMAIFIVAVWIGFSANFSSNLVVRVIVVAAIFVLSAALIGFGHAKMDALMVLFGEHACGAGIGAISRLFRAPAMPE